MPFAETPVIRCGKTDSTNRYAWELLKTRKLPEGTVVSAEEQYAGKGQHGRTWESEPGKNITLSILLYPVFLQAGQHFLLNQCIALAVQDMCARHLGEGTRIKWPNDIYHHHRKVAGMLIENAVRSGVIRTTVAGIGVNINQASFSPALPHASSFLNITGREYELEQCGQELTDCIERQYLRLRAGEFEAIREDYAGMLYGLGEMLTYRLNGKDISGKITGVDEEGRLLLESGGTVLACRHGEVEAIGDRR